MFIKNASDEDVQAIVNLLQSSAERYKNFRAFVYFLDGNELQLKKLNKSLKADKVALCLIPDSAKEETLEIYKINPKAKSTTLVYKQRQMSKNIVNFKAKDDAKGLKAAISEVCK